MYLMQSVCGSAKIQITNHPVFLGQICTRETSVPTPHWIGLQTCHCHFKPSSVSHPYRWLKVRLWRKKIQNRKILTEQSRANIEQISALTRATAEPRGHPHFNYWTDDSVVNNYLFLCTKYVALRLYAKASHSVPMNDQYCTVIRILIGVRPLEPNTERA